MCDCCRDQDDIRNSIRKPCVDSLGKADIRYEHFPELGGRRKAKPDSRNTAWRNDAFRGYADYMETREFGMESSVC